MTLKIYATVLTFLVAFCLLAAAFAPEREKPKPRPALPTPKWMSIDKESEDEVPDSPEQVLITIKTRNGRKWVAIWEEIAKNLTDENNNTNCNKTP